MLNDLPRPVSPAEPEPPSTETGSEGREQAPARHEDAMSAPTRPRDARQCEVSAQGTTEAFPDHPLGRDTSGRFQKGNAIGPRFQPRNQVGIVDGRRAEVLLTTGEAGLRAQEAAAEVFSDLGGEQECSRVLRGVVKQFARVETLLDWHWQRIGQEGPFTRTGKASSKFSALMSLLDRHTRLANTIGLQRKPKAMNLQDYIRQRALAKQDEQQDVLAGEVKEER